MRKIQQNKKNKRNKRNKRNKQIDLFKFIVLSKKSDEGHHEKLVKRVIGSHSTSNNEGRFKYLLTKFELFSYEEQKQFLKHVSASKRLKVAHIIKLNRVFKSRHLKEINRAANEPDNSVKAIYCGPHGTGDGA